MSQTLISEKNGAAARTATATYPIRAMFIQSQEFYGADSGVHALLMRHFDRSKVSVFCACNKDENGRPEKTALPHIQRIPDVTVRPTDFGGSISHKTLKRRLREGVRRAPNVAISLLALTKYVRDNKIDVIHGTEKPRDAFYGTIIARLSGAKMVVHLHVKYENWINAKVQWAMRRADALIGVSDFVAASIVQAGFNAKRVHGVVNCFDFEGEKWQAPSNGNAIRREFGIPEKAPLTGIVARICAWKGHGDLLSAYAIARKRVPELRLLIVGVDDPRAHPGGGSYTAELKRQAAQLGLSDGVSWAGFRTDTPEIFSALDFYSMPTFEEPQGIVFFEAMAMRKAVLSYDSGGVPEVVINKETGILTPTRDIDALADGLMQLSTDATLRARLGEAGRRRLEAKFTPQVMCEQVADIYATTLTAP